MFDVLPEISLSELDLLSRGDLKFCRHKTTRRIVAQGRAHHQYYNDTRRVLPFVFSQILSMLPSCHQKLCEYGVLQNDDSTFAVLLLQTSH
jgi:hypothetical protein